MGLISRVSSRTYRSFKTPIKKYIMSTEQVLFGDVSEQKPTCGGKLLGGKVHGSLARAGKVKGQTPKVEAEEKKKRKAGRAARRAQYNRRFVTTSSAFGGKKKGPNCQADRVAKS